MSILLSVLLALVSLLLPLSSALAQQDQFPPTAEIVVEDFSPMRQVWQPALGNWSVANGTYGNSSGGGQEHQQDHGVPQHEFPRFPPSFEISYEEFFVRARMRNQGTDDTHLVGLVYGYQDSQNYYEVVISAIGTVTMRTVMNGIAVDEVPAVDSQHPAQHVV